MATFISRPRSLVLALCALGTVVLTGCVNTPDVTIMPIQQSQWSRLSGATLAVAARPMPPFADFKSTDGMHGVVATLTAVAAGNELIRKYDNFQRKPAYDAVIASAKKAAR